MCSTAVLDRFEFQQLANKIVISLNPMYSVSCAICSVAPKQVLYVKKVDLPPLYFSQKYSVCLWKVSKFTSSSVKSRSRTTAALYHNGQTDRSLVVPNAGEKKIIKKSGKKEHHLWHKRDSAGSGQKALNLVQTISKLPNEKEAVYSALDKWIAFEAEFPLIAAAKALNIFRKRNQWKCVIQVAKWMLSKGQGATMATYDCLLLAYDMDRRIDEAETLWNMILHAHNRSTSKRLFSRMIALYDHNNLANKVIEVFADMEELGVKPDQDTIRRVAGAFAVLGQEDKQRLVMTKYRSKWKYIHFKGERVRVRA